jgi:hypothetical protein
MERLQAVHELILHGRAPPFGPFVDWLHRNDQTERLAYHMHGIACTANGEALARAMAAGDYAAGAAYHAAIATAWVDGVPAGYDESGRPLPAGALPPTVQLSADRHFDPVPDESHPARRRPL